MLLWNWRGHVTADLLPFDEGLLPSFRAAEVEQHVRRCQQCARQLESIRHAREALRSGLGPQAMPDHMSDVVRHELVSSSARFPISDFRSAISDFRSPISDFRSPISDSRFPILDFRFPISDFRFATRWAIATIAVMLLGGAAWQVGRPWIGFRDCDSSPPPLAFERAARALHEQAAYGGLSLDFESSSPSAIRDWLHDRGAPVAKLVQQPAGSPGRIVPVGASVAQLRGGSASLVRYEIDGHPVTLMTADAAATTGPSSSWPLSKQITHRRDGGLDALTWTAGGQTYALVSDLPGRGTQACLLCHVDPRFRQAVSRF